MFDDIDLSVIAMLSRDKRRTYTSIAAELEVSETTCASASASCKSQACSRFVALCNPITLSHQSVRLMIACAITHRAQSEPR